MHRTEIIAEIGINHNGYMGVAAHMILEAKMAGADVAKFQLYDPEVLLDYSKFSRKDWKAILSSKLSYEGVMHLKSLCDYCDIEFMASAFDLERLGWLEKIGVKRHKIASRSIYNRAYVEAVQATGKPFIVSFGMLDEKKEQIYDTWQRIKGKNKDCSVLYCVSEYPTELKDIVFPSVFDDYEGFQGFSDHTIGISAAQVAITRGALIVEKHLTFSKNANGPDHKCSMSFQELRQLCKFRDDYEEIVL